MDFKFKVGDRVKVARKGSIDWAGAMDKFVGGEYIIISCENCGQPKYEGYIIGEQGGSYVLDYYFCVDSLELAVEVQPVKEILCPRCGSKTIKKTGQGLLFSGDEYDVIKCANKKCGWC